MKIRIGLAGLAVLLGFAIGPAVAQEKIKIGVIVTLSGPAAALGQQVRDGFALAVKDLGGKMGGKDVEVTVIDDELKPDAAVTKVPRGEQCALEVLLLLNLLHRDDANVLRVPHLHVGRFLIALRATGVAFRGCSAIAVVAA